MTTTDQILAAFVIGLCLAIVSLCWSLQQAHHRLDDLEDDLDQMLDQAAKVGRCGERAPVSGMLAPITCTLDAGHACWHKGDNGNALVPPTEWTTLTAQVDEDQTAEQA